MVKALTFALVALGVAFLYSTLVSGALHGVASIRFPQ